MSSIKRPGNCFRDLISNMWQQDSHPIELRTTAMFNQKLEYLPVRPVHPGGHENRVRAGIVCKAEDYIYSSGVDYYTTQKGFIEPDHL